MTDVFYLLHHVRRSGLDQVLARRLDEGLLYIGASAGAVIMGPDIEPTSQMDVPAEAPDGPSGAPHRACVAVGRS